MPLGAGIKSPRYYFQKTLSKVRETTPQQPSGGIKALNSVVVELFYLRELNKYMESI